MRAFGWLCLVTVIGIGCVANDAHADEGRSAEEIRRAIAEIEAEIARIEATVKSLQARAALRRGIEDVTRRRIALEQRAGKRIGVGTRELDPFGRRVEARKRMERQAEPRLLAVGEATYVAKGGGGDAKASKAAKKKKESLEARVARLEAENKKLHAMIKSLMQDKAHSVVPQPPKPAAAAYPIVTRKLAPVAAKNAYTTSVKAKKGGGIEARLDRIEKLLMKLLQGNKANAGFARAPVAPGAPVPPRRVKMKAPPVRVGTKVFEVVDGQPGRTVTYGVKRAPVKVGFRTESVDVEKRRGPSHSVEYGYKPKAAKKRMDDVNAQIRMLEKLLEQAEERMRALERSLGK